MRFRGSSAFLLRVCVLVLCAAGCSREVPGKAHPVPGSEYVGPILVSDVPQLLGGAFTGQNGLRPIDLKDEVYTRSDPADCPWIVVEESPALPRGFASMNSQWWGSDGYHLMVEIAAVYPKGFDARGLLAGLGRKVQACSGRTVTGLTDSGESSSGVFEPEVADDSDYALHWSWRDASWGCDYALVSDDNAVVEIAACGTYSWLNMVELAKAKHARMAELANPKV